MGFSPFVQPDVVRLQLADVYQRRLDNLLKQTTFAGTTLPRKATAEEVAVAQADLDDATEAALWVDVKRELNAGETHAVFANIVKDGGFTAGEKMILDPAKVGFSKVIQYVVGWNFCDPQGRPVPVSIEALGNLSHEVFACISEAVENHEERVAAERVARKNDRGGMRFSSATSSSPFVPAGPLPTFEPSASTTTKS
jgi:hypothetical protein